MRSTTTRILPLAVTLAFMCGSAQAGNGIDEEGFHGYLRAGAGTSTSNSNGPQSCYGLGGNTMKYRLGNECDAYFEGGYTKKIAKSDGVSYLVTLWATAFSPQSDFGDAKLSLAKAYVEARGLDFLNGGTAWVGKRYYYRPDVHMLDLQYINFNGTGGGVDRVGIGPGKFSYGFFKDNDANVLYPDTGRVRDTTAATRHNFSYTDIPANANATIDVALTAITLGVQYGVGPGTGIGGPCCDRIGAAGSTLLGSDVTRLRVFDDLWVQPTWNFGMEMIALVQRDKSDAGGTSTWTSLGARPVYALSKNLKLVAEIGTDRVTSPTGGPAKRLTKITFAPTISAGPGLWSRPELRAFVTYGKWNNAATADVNANNNSGPVYNNNTSGTSYGVQVETWF